MGPAFTFLTTYTEVVNGIPRLALQDGRNVDTSHVREDITRVTEAQAVAGCNGDADGHEIRSRFRLNSVGDAVTHHDGVLQMWIDEELIIDVHDAVLRTSQHPNMKFDQFLMVAHYGPGVPHSQSMWIDDVSIWASSPPATSVSPTSWGQAKQPP